MASLDWKQREPEVRTRLHCSSFIFRSNLPLSVFEVAPNVMGKMRSLGSRPPFSEYLKYERSTPRTA